MIRRWAIPVLCVLSSVLVTRAGIVADDDPGAGSDLWSLEWDNGAGIVSDDDCHQVTTCSTERRFRVW